MKRNDYHAVNVLSDDFAIIANMLFTVRRLSLVERHMAIGVGGLIYEFDITPIKRKNHEYRQA